MNHSILHYFTPKEQALLKARAANKGLDLRTYVRVVLLLNGISGTTPHADIKPVATSPVPVADPGADAPGSALNPSQRKSA